MKNSERAMDIVLPEPRTEKDKEDRRANRWQSELATLPYAKRRKIPISYGRVRYLTVAEQREKTKEWPKHDPDPNNCSGHGQAECLRVGEHSWFHHATDGYYTGRLDNLPAGFVEP